MTDGLAGIPIDIRSSNDVFLIDGCRQIPLIFSYCDDVVTAGSKIFDQCVISSAVESDSPCITPIVIGMKNLFEIRQQEAVSDGAVILTFFEGSGVGGIGRI